MNESVEPPTESPNDEGSAAVSSCASTEASLAIQTQPSNSATLYSQYCVDTNATDWIKPASLHFFKSKTTSDVKDATDKPDEATERGGVALTREMPPTAIPAIVEDDGDQEATQKEENADNGTSAPSSPSNDYRNSSVAGFIQGSIEGMSHCFPCISIFG